MDTALKRKFLNFIIHFVPFTSLRRTPLLILKVSDILGVQVENPSSISSIVNAYNLSKFQKIINIHKNHFSNGANLKAKSSVIHKQLVYTD